MIRSHRIALDANTGQRVALARHAGYARFAYNWALADFKAGLDADEWRGDRTLRPRWNAAKHAVAPWCGAMLQVVAKNAIRDLGRAVDNWKNPKLRARFPSFKRRGGRQAFRLDNGPDTVHIEGQRLHAGRLGCIRMREALRFEGRILGAVVSRTAQRWFVSVTVEDGVDLPGEHEAVGAIGVDVGIMTLAACSDGVTYENPKAHEAALRKLRRTQKAVARSRNANPGKPRSNRQRKRVAPGPHPCPRRERAQRCPPQGEHGHCGPRSGNRLRCGRRGFERGRHGAEPLPGPCAVGCCTGWFRGDASVQVPSGRRALPPGGPLVPEHEDVFRMRRSPESPVERAHLPVRLRAHSRPRHQRRTESCESRRRELPGDGKRTWRACQSGLACSARRNVYSRGDCVRFGAIVSDVRERMRFVPGAGRSAGEGEAVVARVISTATLAPTTSEELPRHAKTCYM